MRKLILAALTTASGLLCAAADARGPVISHANPVPNIALRTPGGAGAAPMQAGVSWQGQMANDAYRTGMRGDRRERRGVNAYPGYRTIERGGRLPGYFRAPSYAIVNHGLYGFGQPANGTRWVRYYDDALLVDGDGRVRDGRYNMDFDRYGDRWGHDGRGIPVYVGDGDYRPGERDYAWSDRFDRDDDGDLAYDRDYPYDHRYGGEGAHGAVHDRGFAYSYGGGYTITETTVTTAPSTVRYFEEPAAHHPAPRRYKAVRRHKIARRVHRAATAPRCVCR